MGRRGGRHHYDRGEQVIFGRKRKAVDADPVDTEEEALEQANRLPYGLAAFAYNTVILALVSAVYFWRAKTEEKHLLGEDPKYREYHAWMAQNAFVTRTLGKLLRVFRPRGPVIGGEG